MVNQLGEGKLVSKTGRKAMGVLVLAVFIDLLGFGIVIPLLPYWSISLGADPFIFGMLVASYSAMQFMFAPIWGRISDRKGRRPVILVGLTGTIIGFSLLSSTALFLDNLTMLFASRIIAGIFTAATLPTSQAYISDTTTGKDRAKGFGLLGASFGLGFAMGPAIGGILFSVGKSLGGVGYDTPALFAVALAIINLLTAIRFLPESLTDTVKQQRAVFKAAMTQARARTGSVSLFRSGVILAIIASFSVMSLGFSGMESTIALFGLARFGMDQVLAAQIFVIVGVIAIVTQGAIIRPLSSRFSDAALIATGLAVTVVAFLGLTTVYTLIELALWVIPLSFGISIANPTLSALLSKKSPEGRQGELLGANQGMGSLMRIFGPLIGTYLFETNTAYPYYASAALIGIALLLILFVTKRARKIPIGTTLCARCGTRLQEGAAYCGKCGFPAQSSRKKSK